MKLYYDTPSGHSHRARLFLSLAGVPAEIVTVPLTQGAHKAPEFLKINPFGQLPVLVDGDVIVPDSNAILVYVAKKFGKTEWLPEDPAAAAAVQRWLSVAAGQIAFGPAAARLVTLFGAKLNAEDAINRAHAVLKLIDAHLEGREFIATDRATIADVALYSYISAAPEGNVDIGGYANVGAWLKRIEALPGFFPFAQNAVGLRAVS